MKKYNSIKRNYLVIKQFESFLPHLFLLIVAIINRQTNITMDILKY